MTTSSLWLRFQKYFLRYEELGFCVDISRMNFPDAFFSGMQHKADNAFAAMRELEAGAIANPDEKRMVGHYWLRNAKLAPNEELRREIEKTNQRIKQFAADVHTGKIAPEQGAKFEHILLIGIGGSALGPQFVADALGSERDAMDIYFLDNTDPDGFDRVFRKIDNQLQQTLVIVTSKSGGTKETRNGMLETEAQFNQCGLPFNKHAVAVTGVGSDLDRHAEKNGWVARFPMWDWVGGRTSVMSAVGLMPMALQGLKIDNFLRGAAVMDERTRVADISQNAAMLLALMWYYAGEGRGQKDMVVLPYKDRLLLFSRYLQQLVMESLGKEKDLDGNVVHQGIAVYGNKGSTDQHAYVQQLRDGVLNFRESITVSMPDVDAFNVGALIALYERAVGFYGSLVNINAYHQPGVEAGKKAATKLLQLQTKVRTQLASEPKTAEAIARAVDADAEDVFHVLQHLASNDAQIVAQPAEDPGADKFSIRN